MLDWQFDAAETIDFNLQTTLKDTLVVVGIQTPQRPHFKLMYKYTVLFSVNEPPPGHHPFFSALFVAPFQSLNS